jgi:hypothetical protein
MIFLFPNDLFRKNRHFFGNQGPDAPFTLNSHTCLFDGTVDAWIIFTLRKANLFQSCREVLVEIPNSSACLSLTI